MAGDQLEPYLGNLGEAATDPLYLEHNLVLPDGLDALNLQDTEGNVGKTVNEILRFLDTHLGTSMSDSSGEDELVINSVLRSFFLNDDGSLRLDSSSVSKVVDPTLFEGHDRLTEFTVILDEVRLYGLDSITRFNSFRNIGKYTLQNELTWEMLKFEFDIILDIKPSTLDEAILIDPTSPGISEHFTIDFALNDIDVEASLLLVLDEVAMGSMTLGPLFFTENLLPCLLSVVQDAELSGLDVDPSYINDGPAVEGLLSSGFDRFISDSVEAAFAMYKGSLRAAIPNIFQTTVRDLINTFVADTFNDDQTSSTCPESQPPVEEIIDFRKFFDAENDVYGDLPSLFKNMIDDELLAINPDTGRPRINEALIAPLTGAQSGSEGTMLFKSDLFSFLVPKNMSQTFGLETLALRLFDPIIVNLDTIGTPIKLLEPNATNGQTLDNYAALGSVERKLRIGFKGLFDVEGEPDLTMKNQMDISVELAGSEAWLSFLANVDAMALSNFPLGDITNLQCWLNTVARTMPEEKGFSIVNAFLTTSSMNFDVSCDSCTSSSLSILPEVLSELEVYGVSDVLENRLVEMIMDLLRSDYSQDLIDELLTDAAIRCPHSPEFIDSSASSEEKPTPEVPSLDYESLETIVFGSTVVTETLAVVMAEAHESYDLETSFPLSGQSDLSVANDMRLFDFASLEESLGKWAGFGVSDFNVFLKEIVTDTRDPISKGMLRVNSIIRSILNESGEFSFKLDDLSLKNLGVGISMKEVNVAGLDSISAFQIFDTIGAQTIQNGINWEDIRVRIVISIEATDGSPSQDITISFGLSDINLSVAILMALDLDLFDTMEMWSIMELRNILPCMMSAAEAAKFTELELSIGTIRDFSITGFVSDEVASAASQSTKMILEQYHDKIVSSIPKVFDSTVRTLLNNWLQYHMENQSSELCEHSVSENIDGNNFVDLRDLLWIPSVASRLGGSGLSQYGDLFTFAIGLIRNVFKVDDTTGLSGFNEVVVEPFTESEGHEPGSIHYSGDLYSGGNRIKVGALDTNLRFRAFDAKVENLNSVGAPIELFGGVAGEPFKLNNTMTAGVGEEPLKFSSKFLLSLESDDNINISNEVDLSLEMTDVNVVVSTFTKIAEARLFSFPLRDVFDLNCWLATIPAPTLNAKGVRNDGFVTTAALSDLEAYIKQLIVKADCTNCTSPRMKELTDLLSSPEAREETTDVANDLLGYVTQLMGGSFLQVQIDRMLNEAARKCPHSPTYDPAAEPIAYEEFEAPTTTYSMGYLILLTVLALTSITIVLIIIFTVKCIVRRRHRKWLIKLPPHQIKHLSHHQKSKQSFENTLNTNTKSMFRSPDVPCIIRFAIPVVILCNILFFLSGHLSLGAAVNIEAEVAGENFVVERFFEFSMARSTIDIWKAGGHELAILIIIFSGIWPYTKLLMTLWLWFSSPSNVSISRRGSILLWLDWLAKWSMIDIFVLVISIAAFRISIASPDTSYLPNDFYAIEMMVVPRWGLYANMIAQLISQVTSHVIIHYHRRVVAKATDRMKQDIPRDANSPVPVEGRASRRDEEASSAIMSDIDLGIDSAPESVEEENVALRSVHFSRPHRGETEKLVARNYVDKLLKFSVFAVVVCVITGCILPSFSLELFGLVGVAVEFGQDFEEATFNHSVFSVIKLLFDQASFLGTAGDYIGLIVLSLLFVSTILFIPIVSGFMLLRQWLSNSTKKQKQKVAVRLEILQAWQYLEVYLVALFISSWQLGKVSDFMVNSYCENLEDMFAQMVYYGVLKEEDAQCFGVTSRIGPNAFVLLAGAISLAFLNSFVCKAFVQYLYDGNPSELRFKGNDDSTDSSQSNGEDEATDTTVDTNIHQVPVLFTDTFRWMLKSSNSGDKSPYDDPNDSHWSLPEATVITSENLTPERPMMKGTYVRDLESPGKTDIADPRSSPYAARQSPSHITQGSIGLVSSISFDSYQSSPRKMKMDLDYNEETNEKYPNGLSYRQARLKSDRRQSLGQQSVSSRMESIGSSSNDETFGAESVVSSIHTSNSIQPPPAEAVSNTSPRSLRRGPPPAQYRLMEKSLKKPPPSYPSEDVGYGHQIQRSDRKPPPPDSFSDADDEYSILKSISDIVNEVDNGGGDFHFEDDTTSFSQQSGSHKRII